MPEEFDPAWEYWEPNPEIAEVMARNGVAEGFDAVIDCREDGRGLRRADGIRFGRGNPDFARFHLAPECPTADRLQPRVCPACRFEFVPDRSSRIYCSNRCYVRRGRERELPDAHNCERCAAPFRPTRRGHWFCSLKCHNDRQRDDAAEMRRFYQSAPPGPIGRPRVLDDIECPGCGDLFRPVASDTVHCSHSCALRCSPIYRPKRIDDERLTKLYLAGYTLAEIAREFGVTATAIRSARKRLGLPRRE